MRRLITLLILIIGATTSTYSQVKSVADYINDVTAISTRPDVKAANDYIDQNHDRIMREWIAITEINAPSGHEHQRAKYLEGLLRAYHVDVHYDSAGNLIAVRKGTGGGPVIVFDAHLDTVFQPGLQIKATIKDGKVYAPGIGNNCDSRRFSGPSSHTRSRTPPYSATLPLARTIDRIYRFRVPTPPSSNLNIGRLGGSEVVNAKAADAWFSVDLRSASNDVIADLEKQIKTILDEEAARVGMTVKTDAISVTPAASIPGHRESYLVRMAEAVHRVMGFDPPITNAGSNNGNIALLAGISSISTGAGPCDGSHSLAENCEIEPFYNGIKKTLLLQLALAGVQ